MRRAREGRARRQLQRDQEAAEGDNAGDNDDGAASTGTFRQETEAMDREGALTVYPYRVREGVGGNQRRLRMAREIVDKGRRSQGESEDVLRGVGGGGGSDVHAAAMDAAGKDTSNPPRTLASSSVQFMSAAAPQHTQAQVHALEMVQKELDAVEAEAQEALAAMLKRNEELDDAQEELRRFALKVERAQKAGRYRRPPPPEPLPLPFQLTAAAALRSRKKAKLQAEAEAKAKAEAEAEHRAKRVAREERRLVVSEKDSLVRVAEHEKGRSERDAKEASEADAERKKQAEKRAALDAAAERSYANRVLVECPGCGEVVELLKLPRHQREDCENRLVPCKNFEYGCSCMVRVRDRARHEDASALLRPRPCLWFGGPSKANRIALDEEDVSAPWTAEYWVFRPSAAAASVALVEKALALREVFVGLFETMADTKFRVDSLEQKLASSVMSMASQASSGRSAGRKGKGGGSGLEKKKEKGGGGGRSKKKGGGKKGGSDSDDEDEEDGAAAAKAATKGAADLLLAANDEFRKVAVRVAAVRAGYVDLVSAAGRRLAEADAELEELEDRNKASKTRDGFNTRLDLERAVEPVLLRFVPGASGPSPAEKLAVKLAEDAARAEVEAIEERRLKEEREAAEDAALEAEEEAKERRERGEEEEEDKEGSDDEDGDEDGDDENGDEGAAAAASGEGGEDDGQGGDEDEDEKAEEEEVKVVKMTLPEDWVSPCYTARELINAIKGHAMDERQALNSMVAMMTDSQGQRKKKVVTGAAAGGKKQPTSERAKRKLKRKEKAKAKREEKAAAVTGGQGLPFAEQISRAVKGRQGRDTVGSSETVRLQLEVGDRDEVGVSIPDLGEFTFTDPGAAAAVLGPNPAKVPRGKWVHVAFVATPANKLLAYINGHVVKRKAADKDDDDNDNGGGGGSKNKGGKNKVAVSKGKEGKSDNNSNAVVESGMSVATTSSGKSGKTSKGGGGKDKGGEKEGVSDNGIDMAELRKELIKMRRVEDRANATSSSSSSIANSSSGASSAAGGAENSSGGGGGDVHNKLVLGLPMRDIGEASGAGKNPAWAISGPSCLLGALQEVRYWASARSKGQLRGFMHKLLDDDAPKSQGLIGWFTFEEGKGSAYAVDVTEARFRSKLVGLSRGRGLEWAESEEVAFRQQPPTPAWRERAACAVEIRRVRLAVRGRKLLESVPCSSGCGESVPRKNMRFHQIYHCRSRQVGCWHCGKGDIPYEQLSSHLRDECPHAQASKQWMATRADAGSLVPCMLCDQPIMKRWLGKHQQEECPERLVSCRFDCGFRIVAHRLPRHETEECEAPAVVELRGLPVRARKLRRYERSWSLEESERPASTGGGGAQQRGRGAKKGGKKHKKPVVGPLGNGEEEEEGPPYVSVRRDPFTRVKMGLLSDVHPSDGEGAGAGEEP